MSWLRSSFILGALTASLSAQAPLPSPPGKLFDIDRGRRLHLLCTGQGSPTVVIEAGASSFAIDFTLVQRELQMSHRVCSYDRAGMGWSDALPAGGLAAESTDLHAVLNAAGERPPYVMIGASRGGLLVRAYLIDYPDEVAGLVLVDPASEDRLYSMVKGQPMLIAEMTAEQIRSGLPGRGVRTPRRSPQTGAPFNKLPAELYQQRVALDERLIASAPEMMTPETIFIFQESERALLAKLLATRASKTPFGNRPTVVLSRGDERDQGREDVHAALARLSTNSRHAVIAGAGHEIHLFRPEAVITAIDDVLESVARKTKLPAR